MKALFLKFAVVALALLASVSAKAQSVSTADESDSVVNIIIDPPITSGSVRVSPMREKERLALINPAKGRLVFQTDGDQPGFWYNAGTRSAPVWVILNPESGVPNHTADAAPKLAGS